MDDFMCMESIRFRYIQIQKNRNPYRNYGLKSDRRVRTRDPDLGKVVLYQLSHYRVLFAFPLGTIHTIL